MMRTLLLALLLLAPSLLAAEEIIPNDGARLARAIGNAKRGETITIPAGIYEVGDVKVRKSVNLVGDGEVVLVGTRVLQKGLLDTVLGASLRVENITFKDAEARDHNGAGIRHEGEALTIVNCKFIGNENGVLANGSPSRTIEITNSEFLGNGYGDGYTHGIYVVAAGKLDIKDSRFAGTKIGHHVKSLASVTTITGTDFDDSQGSASYAVDVSRGGDVTISGNSFLKSADADNESIINYDLTRGGKAIGLRITNNKIVNRNPDGKLLRNDTPLTPIIEGNELTNENGGNLSGLPKQTGALATKPAAVAAATISKAPASSSDLPTKAYPLALEKLSPVQSQKSGIIAAPKFASVAGALLNFRLENNWKEASAADYLTFGQAFPVGALPYGAGLVARFGATDLPVQIDVKALHPDGSIRHAAITIETPPLKGGAKIDGALIPAMIEQTAPVDAIAISKERYDFPVAVDFGEQMFSMNARSALVAELAKAKPDYWLNGPLVREVRLEQDAAPHLKLRYDVRVYRDGDIRTSVAFSNEKTFSPGVRDVSYDVAIGGGALAEPVLQHRSSVWRRLFWTGSQPKLHLVRDLQPMIASGALLPVDSSQGAAAAVIASNDAASRDQKPLASALINKYMPTTGGRGEIGIYPQWTALYLVAQTEPSIRAMLANAEVAGAVPWHFIDEKTSAPISVELRKKFWGDPRGLEEWYKPDQPNADLFKSSDGGWTADHSHQAALSYVPYLVTADRFYADELAMQAAWTLAGRWPDLREGGLKAFDFEEVRATAWSMRDLSDAAFILPDRYPSKIYFNKALRQSLAAMKDKYVVKRAMKGAGEVEGYIEEMIDREPERISPWQNDYVALSLWLAARRGEKDAAALLAWAENFQAGRFLSADFDIKRATDEFHAKDAATQKPFATWKEVAAHTYGKAAPVKEMEGYPTMAAGYVGSAYAALTAIASETHSPRAIAALERLAKETAALPLWSAADSGVTASPQFLFMLTKADGSYVTRADVARALKSGNLEGVIGAPQAASGASQN